MHGTYGEKGIYGGPILKKKHVKEKEMILEFDTSGKRLILKGDTSTHAFALVGVDQKFYWATVKQEGNKLVLNW